MELIYLLAASLIIMLASLAGVLFVVKKLGSWTEKNIQYLVAFAAGVFLIVSYDLIFEALEFGKSAVVVSMSVIFGFIIFYLFEKFYPESHCHHEDNKCLSEKSKRGAKRIIIGDAFHNIGDGILLAPIFLVDVKLGFIAAVGIFVHEFVQEISEYFVLRAAGYSMKKALAINFAVSATVLIGAVGGYYLSSVFDFIVGPLIGLAAGAFIYILVVDLIPESIKHSHREKKYLAFAAWALVGILIILTVNVFVSHGLEELGLDGHGHLEGDGEYHDDEHEEHNEHEDEDEHEGEEEEHHDDEDAH